VVEGGGGRVQIQTFSRKLFSVQNLGYSLHTLHPPPLHSFFALFFFFSFFFLVLKKEMLIIIIIGINWYHSSINLVQKEGSGEKEFF